MKKVLLKDFQKAKQVIHDYYNQDFKKLNGIIRPCICCKNKIKPIEPELIRFPQSGMYNV